MVSDLLTGSLLLSCLFLSAYFSGLEMALTTLSHARAKKLIEERPLHAIALSLWLKKPSRVLTTILVGNNIVNTLAAAIAAVLAQSFFASHAITIATFFITLLLLIFGEITPKTFGRHNAEKIAPLGLSLLLPFYGVLLPITLAMSYLADKLVKFVSEKYGTKTFATTEEDVAYMIKLGNQEGVLKRNDGNLLESVIEFRKTLVKESMVPRTEIESFDVNTTYEEVLARLVKEGHTRWPVYESNIDNIIGIFHAKDLLRQIGTHSTLQPFSLTDFLRPAKFIPDRMKIGSLLKEFQAGKAHLAIVVDEYGGTAGIISLEDVLEEIVGEIRDEYDDEERERTVQKLDDDNFLVSGRAKIFELGKVLEVSFPESDLFDSLGGFLTEICGRMPAVSEAIHYQDCTFVIKAADEKKITQVHVHRRLSKLLSNDDATLEKRAAA
jgi:putative hemolysin